MLLLAVLAGAPRNPRLTGMVALLTLVSGFAVEELTAVPGGLVKPFNWIPLYGEIGNNLNGIANLLGLLWVSIALGIGFCLLLSRQSKPRISWTAVVFAGAILFVLEWLQTRVQGRQGDITASLIGMLGAAWGSYLASVREWWPDNIPRASEPDTTSRTQEIVLPAKRKLSAFDQHDQAMAAREKRRRSGES